MGPYASYGIHEQLAGYCSNGGVSFSCSGFALPLELVYELGIVRLTERTLADDVRDMAS